ncbi:MAG: branched-chain amino acid ABC transporter permease [Bacteroidetes bacterium]|nr:branched-chain amino acid ABC transporter permease [Bacteroidota bacterium]
MLSLAQAVFYGIGAYATAITITKFGFSYWLALPAAMFICVFMALLFSFIAGQVRELYFSLATIALQIIFFSVVYNWIPVTNGSYRISGISNPEICKRLLGLSRFDDRALLSLGHSFAASALSKSGSR